MRAGKDVFVEKPMALSIRRCRKMQSRYRKKGRILMVGHLLEYHPAVLKLREMILQNLVKLIIFIQTDLILEK